MYANEPWHRRLPYGVSIQLPKYLTASCTDAEGELRADLAAFAEKLAAFDAAAAAAASAAQKEREQQQEALQQQLDAVQLQLGQLYAVLSGQLCGAAVVFAEAGALLEAVESSEGVLGLGSVRWLVADCCRGLDRPAAAADVDAGSLSDQEKERAADDDAASASAHEADDEDDSYDGRLMQLAKLLPGGRNSGSSRDSVGAWQLQDSSQAARLVYITQVCSAAVQCNMCCFQFSIMHAVWYAQVAA
jgi:hypothetical protein